MKKRKLLTIFVGLNLALIILHIHKQSLFVRELYRTQRLHKHMQEISHKKQLILNQLYAYKNPTTIKEFALYQLGMEPIALTQIKTVPS